MVCAKRTIGSETILDTTNDIQGDEAQVEAQLNQCGDCTNLDAR
jgi:hypothetical protein